MNSKHLDKKSSIHKTKKLQQKCWSFVDPQGFEPQLMVPKTRVLPLHHGSIFLLWCKFKTFFICYQVFFKKNHQFLMEA